MLTPICNRFLDMYVECGNIGDAQKLFDEMGDKDLFSCNTMLFGYAKVGRLKLARKLSNEMPQRENFRGPQ
jgi:pentatricopeptide repeat protein